MTNQNTALPTSLPDEAVAILAEFNHAVVGAKVALETVSGSAGMYVSGAVHSYSEAQPTIDALLAHIRQQESTIKTLEMQGKWLDIKDAPRDGKPLIGLCSYLYPGDKDLTVSVNEITWHNEFWQDHEGNHPEGFYTHFQYINPPSPVAPKVRERCIYSVARMLYRKYDSDYDAEGLTIKDFIEEATGYVDAVLREVRGE